MDQVIPQTLFESIGLDEAYFSAWERDIHPVLVEVALSADTINQLFTNIEKSATASGDNRTLAGKAKDLPGQISDVWYNKFGAMLKQSGPIKAADEKFNDLKQKIRAANPDSKVIAAIDKYAEYAKQHPNMQKFLLAIAGSVAAALGVAAAGGVAAGALAVGTGTGVAVGIVNIADRLLKGQDLSTAVGRGGTAGLTAGLTAAAVTKVASVLKDTLANVQQGREVHRILLNPGTPMQKSINLTPADGRLYEKFSDQILKALDTSYGGVDQMFDPNNPINKTLKSAYAAQDAILAKALDPSYQQAVIAAAAKAGETAAPIADAIKGITSLQQILTPIGSALAGQAGGNAQEKPTKESRELNLEETTTLFLTVEHTLLSEGLWDKVKTVGHNITTKVTADKLQSAWKAAGSPTDSEAIKQILIKAGVASEVVDSVYKQFKIPATTNTAQPQQNPQQQTNRISVKQINQIIRTMKSKDLQSLQHTVDAALARRRPA
jgi:hypothetical protein